MKRRQEEEEEEEEEEEGERGSSGFRRNKKQVHGGGGVSRATGRRNKVGREITIFPFPSLFHLFDRSYLTPLV